MTKENKLNIRLLSYQYELLSSDRKYKGFIGGTGTGKTYFVPIYLAVKMAQNRGKEWIVSAPTTAMLRRTVYKYVKNGFARMGIEYEENKSDFILETEDGIIYFISAEVSERMQGIHPKGIIGDEAGLYSREWWETAVQRIAFSQGEILLTTTPYSPNHWLKLEFYDRWKNGDKDFLIVNPTSIENPFYPKEEYLKAKKRLPKWKFSLLFDAEFPEEDSNALFKFRDIEYCTLNDENKVNEIMEDFDWYLTVDVAREGNDQSVIIVWKGFAIKKILKYEKNTLRELTSHIIQEAKNIERENGVNSYDINIVIDKTGLGAGVYEEVYYDSEYNVIGVNFAENAFDKEKYGNIRAEMYHELAEAVEDKKVKLIDDDDLIEDLLIQERRFKPDGRILLKSKEELKKDIGRSPDTSDAVALRFAVKKSRVGIV